MKFSKKFYVLTLSLLLITAAVTPLASAAAVPVVSPGLAVLAEKTAVTVTGMNYSAATFRTDTFDTYLGCRVDEITVLTLPDPAEGTLYLGNVPVAVNQSIGRKNFSRLVFKPAGTTGAEASFYFTKDGTYPTECNLFVIGTANLSPVVTKDSISIKTSRGTSVFGSVTAADPEDDELTCYVTDYPEKGTVVLDGDSFVYTPKEGKRGRDSFSLCVVDEYGNRSDEVKVYVKISKSAPDIEYTDLDGHWAAAAAEKMVNAGVMQGEYVNGVPYFYPGDTVTREEFITMVMKTVGLSDIPEINKAVFTDDGEIGEEYRNYCRAAEKLGFINGSEADGKIYFKPKSTITRAEVAVILQNIIKVKVDDSVAVFADNDSIPSWAYESIYAMKQIGVMNGVGDNAFSPNSTLTRAEVATILASVIDMVK